MIGLRVGLACGITAGIAAGMSADPTGGGTIPMILVFGDSNVVGESTTDTADPAFNVTVTQSTAVVRNHDFHYALSASDPITYQPDQSGGVHPWTIGGSPGMGTQISIGQVLNAAGRSCVMASFGIFGLPVAQSIAASTYPTQPPGGPNVNAQLIARAHAVEATWGAQTRVILISNGGNDGADNTNATNLDTNSASLLSQLQTAFPSAVVFWCRINADTVNASGFTFEATAITKQDAFFTAHPSSVTPLDSDDCALLSDHSHYTSDTALVVGQRFAYLALDALGFARPRATDYPAVLGFGPLTFGPGTGPLTPHSWGGAQDKHLEILVAVTLTPSGVNNTITTPTGWSLIDTTASVSAGATTRVAFYQRNVTSAMLAANRSHTAATSVAAANLDEFQAIITIGSPTPGSTPTIEASQLSVNNAFNTSLAMTGLNTLGAKRTIVMITAGFRTNQSPNAVTITAPNLSNITVIRNSTRDSGRTNDCTIDVQTAQLAVQGSTGNPSVTSALAMITVGGVFSIAP